MNNARLCLPRTKNIVLTIQFLSFVYIFIVSSGSYVPNSIGVLFV